MNNKEKQFEEMAKIIADKMCYAFIDGRCSLNGIACDLICKQGDEYKEVAEALYNTDYRKAGKCEDAEDSVDGEYLPPKDQEKERNIDAKIAKACKETAKEILQGLYDEATSRIDELVDLATFQIEQLAKKYGVEVE